MYKPEGKGVPPLVFSRTSSNEGPLLESGVKRGLIRAALVGFGACKRVRDQSTPSTTSLLVGVSKSRAREASMGVKQMSGGAESLRLEGFSGKKRGVGKGDSVSPLKRQGGEEESL